MIEIPLWLYLKWWCTNICYTLHHSFFFSSKILHLQSFQGRAVRMTKGMKQLQVNEELVFFCPVIIPFSRHFLWASVGDRMLVYVDLWCGLVWQYFGSAVSVVEGGVWHQGKQTELNSTETQYPLLLAFEEVLLSFYKEGVRVHKAVKKFRLSTASSWGVQTHTFHL